MSPHSSRKMFAKKTRNYDLALQGSLSSPPTLMVGGFSNGGGTFPSARWHNSFVFSAPPSARRDGRAAGPKNGPCAASPTGVMQERRGDPPSKTVQAPHWPSPQPYLLPTRSRSARKTLSRLAPPSTSTEYFTPLMSSSLTFDMKHPRVSRDPELWRKTE
jgi:hypothetical protein